MLLQGRIVVPCKVLIELRPPKESETSLTGPAVAAILVHAHWLEASGLSVCISLTSNEDSNFLSPRVLKQIAPIIHEVNGVPADAAAPAKSQQRYTLQHLSALLPARDTMQALCLSDYRLPHGRVGQSSMHLLARFANLQKLDLVMAAAPDFSPLVELRQLQELHLSIAGNACCATVLEGCKQQLQAVNLSAQGWSNDTYDALPTMTKLQTLKVSQHRLAPSNAKILADLLVPNSVEFVVKNAGRYTITHLSSGYANITHLTLYNIDCRSCRYLQTMNQLSSLTLGNSDLVASVFPFQPKLLSVELVNVNIDHADLSYMMHSFPALERLVFLKRATACQHQTILSQASFVAMFQASCLKYLSMTGVANMDVLMLAWLEAYVRSQQAIGMAEPKVFVKLPALLRTPLSKDQVFSINYLEYPVFCSCKFDEQKPRMFKWFQARVVKPIGQKLRKHRPRWNDVNSYWFVPQDRVGVVLVSAIFGIHIVHYKP